MIKIASFNVENLFSRPRAFNTIDWTLGQPVLDAYYEVNGLFQQNTYSTPNKQRMRDLLVVLDIYSVNSHGAIRRKQTPYPRWAWLRKNRGMFDHQPKDATQHVEITADGRDNWIGWVELATTPTNEVATRMTAKVIQEVNADIIGIIEAEDRPSLVRFNKEFLNGMYEHIMLVDGNDERGIDVGIMTKPGFEIKSIRSNVDTTDATGIIFSRDCPQYEIRRSDGTVLHVLVNHFKSQSGGGDAKRLRQAAEVRRIVDSLVGQGHHVIVLGDFNEGPTTVDKHASSLGVLYSNNSPLVDCYSRPEFDAGNRPGTFDACGIRNRLDYIFISHSLIASFRKGEIFRKGLWGSRKTQPDDWDTYHDITNSSKQASDHAAVYIELDI